MVSAKTNGAARPKSRKSRPGDSGWRRPVRAKPFKGGGVLRQVVTNLASGDLVLPNPSSYANGNGHQPRAFDENGHYQLVAGLGKHDPPVRIRSGGGFSGSNVARFVMSLSDRETTERPYEENFVVRSGTRAFASGMNRLPFQLWNGPPADEDSVVIEEHPLLDLLSMPNRLQSGFEMTKAHTIDFKLDGEVFWFLMNKDGKPVKVNEANGLITEFPKQILSVRGDNVEHKTDESGMPVAYRYIISKDQKETIESNEFPWQAVIPFIEYDPYNMVRGLGDVRALTREVDLMFQAYRYLDAVVKNGGDPGGFITFDETIGQDELTARQAELDETFMIPNAGRVRILDRKAKWTPNPTKPNEMEWSTLFDWCLKAICAGIGTPPPVIGWYEDATYNNLEGAFQAMWGGPNGILSYSAGKQDVMRTKLIARLAGTPEIGRTGAEDLFPFYNPSNVEVLKKDRSEQILVASKIAASGVGVAFNESLSMLELNVEPAEAGDTPYVHMSLREVGEPSTSAVAVASGGKAQPTNEKSARGEWRTIELRADPNTKVTKAVREWFGKYEAQILVSLRVFANGGKKPSARGGIAVTTRVSTKDLTLAALKGLALNESQWALLLSKALKIPLADVWRKGLKVAQGKVGGGLVAITDPRVISAIADQLILVSEGVGSTTADRVRRAILRVLQGTAKEGSLRSLIREALPELTRELRSVFGSKDARALAISVTETNSGTEAASFLQMSEAGIGKKRWRHAGDANVRQSHIEMQAVGAIPLNEKFPNGGMHPLDVSLPPGERVNCRCHLEAEVPAAA